MDFAEADIPCEIKHGEILTLDDGSCIRWESNGEAKNVFLTSGFEADVEIFPGNDHTFEKSGKTFKLTAMFHDALKVEKI